MGRGPLTGGVTALTGGTPLKGGKPFTGGRLTRRKAPYGGKAYSKSHQKASKGLRRPRTIF